MKEFEDKVIHSPVYYAKPVYGNDVISKQGNDILREEILTGIERNIAHVIMDEEFYGFE